MIVPQLASGGCTPIERNDSAASVSIASATISGKRTITVVITFGRSSLQSRRHDRRAEPDRGLHELPPAERQHLASHRPPDVRDVDDPDDHDRQHEAPRLQGVRPQRRGCWSAGRSTGRSRTGTTGNAQTTSRSRDSTPSTAPPKKPAARPISVPNRQVMSAAARRRSAASCGPRTACGPRRRGPGCLRPGSSAPGPRSARSA